MLDALEADHDYLLEGGVFTSDVIDTWVDYKRESTRSTRSGCVRTRTSSRFTTTSSENLTEHGHSADAALCVRRMRVSIMGLTMQATTPAGARSRTGSRYLAQEFLFEENATCSLGWRAC